MPRSSHGGRHELGQNFLHDRPTLERLTMIVARTEGSILEIGAGDGALTRGLAGLGRPLTAIELDEHRVARLRRALPATRVLHADALVHPLRAAVLVGNVPFHLTTPILRRILRAGHWHDAVLLTQWEVARKRAGVGGRTMMTAQAEPWFTFELHGRVASRCFTPRPSVDGGILAIRRRCHPLVPSAERSGYERFVRAVFTGRGGTLAAIVQHAGGLSQRDARRALASAGVDPRALPRDLGGEQWAALWREVRSG